MVKILFLLGLCNACFFLPAFLFMLNVLFFGFGLNYFLSFYGYLFQLLFFPTLVSGALSFILAPIIIILYLLGKKEKYNHSSMEVLSFRLNITVLGLAILGYFLGSAIGAGMSNI